MESPIQVKDAGIFIKDIGVPAAMCIFLSFILWYEIGIVKKDLNRIIGNERVIMSTLGIKFEVETIK